MECPIALGLHLVLRAGNVRLQQKREPLESLQPSGRMKAEEGGPREFGVDEAHAAKRAVFGAVLVLTCVLGVVLGWGSAEDWFGFVPWWLVWGVSGSVMLPVTAGWIKRLASDGPVLRIDSSGVWTPASGVIPWDRIKDVRCGSGAVHLVVERSAGQQTAGARLTAMIPWRRRDSQVVPVSLGRGAREAAEAIIRGADLPTRSFAPSWEETPWRRRLVYAFIVATLGTIVDTLVEGVSSPVIWLVSVMFYFVLEWSARRWLVKRTSDSA